MDKFIDSAHGAIAYPVDMPDRYRMPALQAVQRANGQWRRKLATEELFFTATVDDGNATIITWWVQPIAVGARERRRERRKDLQR